MITPTYDPGLNIEWLRNHPATVLTDLDADDIWHDWQADENIGFKEPIEFVYAADMADLLRHLATIPREEVAGTARDLLDRYNATHPEHWQGRSGDLLRLGLDLIRDYADVCVVHGCDYADCPEGPHDAGMDI